MQRNHTFSPIRIINHHQLIKQDPKNSYNSWKYCYSAFSNIEANETILALHLGFYLASWGMYRGSAAISHKDYTIHIETVKIIKQFYHLRCNDNVEVARQDIEEVMKLCKTLKDYYSSFKYLINEEMVKREPTDTLISKIIIGTLGCSPAFDRYFKSGAKKHGYRFIKLNKESFEKLFVFKSKFEKELTALQKQLKEMDNFHYPMFKIIDKYFWHEGLNTN